MKGLKMSKQLRYMLIAFVLVIICSTTHSKGTNTSPEEGNSSDTSNLPYIEMKVKAIKVGETNQFKVECWASNFNYLEGIETVFTYDSTKLTPSYINGDHQNEALTGLESIKYDKRPQNTDAQESFDKASCSLLKNSFAFESAYTDVLDVDVFRFLATEGNNEALQFVVTKKDYLTDVSATEPILLGTFSFRQTENTIIEENEFATKRIKVICDDGLTPDDLSAYIREEANGEDCTEIIEFVYEKYGSISGTIETGYYKPDIKEGAVYTLCGNKRVKSKKTATIYLFNAADVASINWNATSRAYTTARKKIINFMPGEYSKAYIPDENATTEIQYVKKIKTSDGDEGVFKIENIEFGEYVIFVDKYNYGDYIITNITIDSSNKDIDLGKISLVAGDLNKDGIFNTAGDRNPFTLLMKLDDDQKAGKQDLSLLGLNFAYDLNDDGKAILAGDRNIFTFAMQCIDKKTIKRVVDYTTL